MSQYIVSPSSVWIIVGASRGIGLELVRQLLARGDRVYAVIRDPANASQLWALAGAAPMANCELLECDVANEASIIVRKTIPSWYLAKSNEAQRFARDIADRKNLDRIDYVVLNAGILKYPNHLAAELQRKKIMTTVLAMHPGEVATDMANVSIDWEIEGSISPQESVYGMLDVITTKDMRHTGTFWTWQGNVDASMVEALTPFGATSTKISSKRDAFNRCRTKKQNNVRGVEKRSDIFAHLD
ncbi:MAG: hypothetical protein Q9217_006238 [Psora testacea]